jgi:FkbM family methyltransferase
LDPVEVIDNVLGPVLFPKSDQVMVPYIQATGSWNKDEIDWLSASVKQGDTCLNIGANVGYYSKLMLRLSGSSGSVIAIEPNPRLIGLLKANLNRETNKNFEIFEFAAGDAGSQGETTLFLNEKNFGDSRVFDPREIAGDHDHKWYGFDDVPAQVQVQMRSVDSLLRGKQVNVVVVDTQGWDYHALKGMRDTIRRWRPKILFEFTPEWLVALDQDPLRILMECQSWGYSLGCLELAITGDGDPRSILEALSQRPELDHVNITLTPKPTFLRRMLIWLRSKSQFGKVEGRSLYKPITHGCCNETQGNRNKNP